MLNKITIHGYCGRSPEKQTVQGQNGPYSKTAVSVGVSRDFGDDTDWFYCVFYGKKADAVEKWFRKGSQIIVTGRMESYKPKNNPQTTAWLLVADSFDFCDKNTNSDGSRASAAEPDEPEPTIPATPELDEEDIPF